jgi:hypothetical protein
MCSDPITTVQPHTGEVVTYACRKCDDCIATRRHGWVARAMAEKAENSHAVCVTLTYADNTEQRRDAAAMFAYADIKLFLGALRAAARREAKRSNWNIVPQIRFLCAGEQGDRIGRCHWHMIIYSNFDLTLLGKFRLRGNLVSHRRDIETVGKRKRRLNWTLWPHGFMTVQTPDQGAMSYVLSYCLKDQFTHEKSKGTMRESKSENFATGLFRMSKRPAIGESWLMRKLEGLEATGSVLPSLQLSIPDFAGYWHPNGLFREKLLWGLVALNQRVVWATGAPAPQWSSLLASCADNETDMEILNGQIEKPETFDQIVAAFALTGEAYWAAVAAQNGRNLPYSRLIDGLTLDELKTLGVRRDTFEKGHYSYKIDGDFSASFLAEGGGTADQREIIEQARARENNRTARYKAVRSDPFNPDQPGQGQVGVQATP